MFFASVAQIGFFALTIGLSLLGGLLKKKEKKSFLSDQEPATTASRGDYVPRLWGRRRVGAVVGWVGNRKVTKEAGGKKVKGGEKVKTYWESAIHWLAIGPGEALYRIWSDGKIIFDTTITPGTHASGSTITITQVNGVDNAEGTFKIYWGEAGQPINTDLGLVGNDPAVNVDSRWPYIMYIHWIPKQLGLFPRWPNIEYEISVSTFGSTTHITGTPAATGTGLNPAHIIADGLFQEFPHGIGQDATKYNLTTLESVAATLNTEAIAGSIIIKNGDTLKQAIATLMQDMGLFVTLNDGLLEFRLIREPSGNIPVIPDEAILNGEPEIEKRLHSKLVEKLVFGFKDRARNYRQSNVTSDDDGIVKLTKSRRGRSIDIGSTTEFASASVIALRRAQEELGQDFKVDLEVNHGARNLVAGDSIFAAGIPVSLRVMGSKPDPYSAKTELECLADFYGLAPTSFTNPGEPPQYPALAPSDPIFRFLENPGWGIPGSPAPGPGPGGGGGGGGGNPAGGGASGGGSGAPGGSGVLGIGRRKKDNIIIDEEYISEDNVSFRPLGPMTVHAAGGLLKTALGTDQAFYSTFEVLLDEIDQETILDLSSDQANWKRGRQVLIIGNEIMFLESVSPTGGANHEMNNVIRGRYSTPIEAHSVDDEVFIIEWEDVSVFHDLAFLPDATVYFKAQPITTRGGYDLSLVTSQSLTLYGNGYRPLPPQNLRVERYRGNTNVWVTGQDLVFNWAYKGPKTMRTGAGEQGYGERVYARTEFEGYFTVELLEASVVVATKTNITDLTVTFTWAELFAAFGVPPLTFQARITNTAGNFVSEALEIDINAY